MIVKRIFFALEKHHNKKDIKIILDNRQVTLNRLYDDEKIGVYYALSDIELTYYAVEIEITDKNIYEYKRTLFLSQDKDYNHVSEMWKRDISSEVPKNLDPGEDENVFSIYITKDVAITLITTLPERDIEKNTCYFEPK